MLGLVFLLCLFPLVLGRPSFTNEEFDIRFGLSFVLRWKDAKEPMHIYVWSKKDLEARLAGADIIGANVVADYHGTSFAWMPFDTYRVGREYVFEIRDAKGENNFSKPWKLKANSVGPASSRAEESSSKESGDISMSAGSSSVSTDIWESAITEVRESAITEVVESSSIPNFPSSWDTAEGLTSSFTTIPTSSKLEDGPRQTSSTSSAGPDNHTGPPNSSTEQSNSAAAGGLNTGAKIGIGISCGLVGIVILVGAGFFIYRRGQKSAMPEPIESNVVPDPEGSEKDSSTLAARTPQPHEMDIVSHYNEMDVVSGYHELGNDKLADRRRSQEPFEL